MLSVFFVLTHGLEDVLELAGVSTGQLHFAELALTEQGDFAGLLLVGDHGEVVTGFRRTVQTGISTGMAGPASFTGLPFSSSMARTRPKFTPHRTISPWRSVPS